MNLSEKLIEAIETLVDIAKQSNYTTEAISEYPTEDGFGIRHNDDGTYHGSGNEDDVFEDGRQDALADVAFSARMCLERMGIDYQTWKRPEVE